MKGAWSSFHHDACNYLSPRMLSGVPVLCRCLLLCVISVPEEAKETKPAMRISIQNHRGVITVHVESRFR